MSTGELAPRGSGGQLAESVDEHREAIEAWADSDLPLADDMRSILESVDQ